MSNIIWSGVSVCNCECHKEGKQVLHFMSCCNLCYDTYLTKDGEIIPEKLQPLLRESFTATLERQMNERKELSNFIMERLIEDGLIPGTGVFNPEQMDLEQLQKVALKVHRDSYLKNK